MLVHEYRRFVQAALDTRGWRQADLVRHSGLTRQLVSSILTDDRDHLGQMPDDSTIVGLARGLGVPAEAVRTAAARALSGYVDDGRPLTPNLGEVPIDELLGEIRRRVVGDESQHFPAAWRAPAGAVEDATVGRDKNRDKAGKLGRR